MEPILRDTLLLLYCWILPIGVSLSSIIRIIGRLIFLILRPIKRKIPYIKNIKLKAFYPDSVFTLFKKELHNLLFFSFYLILLLIVSTLFIANYFYSKPNVVWTSTNEKYLYFNEREKIKVEFDKPVNIEELEVVTLPENVKAKISYESPLQNVLDFINSRLRINLILPVYTKIIIAPQNSIPYETGLVFYLRNITDLAKKGGFHEHAISVKTPDLPEIVRTNPINGEVDIPIDSGITLYFDSYVTNSLNVKMISEEDVESHFVINGDKVGKIVFDSTLKQGHQYNMVLVKQTQLKNLENDKTKEYQDFGEEYQVSFTTVPPAGTKKITPNGTSVSPSSDIIIEFTESMNTNSFEDNIIIEPSIEFSKKWDENKEILTIIPKKDLEKATKYSLTIKKEIKTEKGGTLPLDAIHKFETLGYVKVIAISPRNNSTGNSITTPIKISFDQKVDHESAQKKISISPKIDIKFSWKNNQLILTPKSSFKYSTKYTIKIDKGIKSIEGIDSDKVFTRYFTTRSQTVTIYVPLYDQPGYFDCNLTAASMALAGKGVSASVSSIRSYIGAVYGSSPPSYGDPNQDWINYYGVHWGPIASYIKYRGRSADIKSYWSLSGIASEINKGNPVIIWWYNGVSSTGYPNSWYSSVGAKPGMHSVVVYGFTGSVSNPSYFYVRDPWYAYRKSFYTSSQFLSKWNYMGRRAVVVK